MERLGSELQNNRVKLLSPEKEIWFDKSQFIFRRRSAQACYRLAAVGPVVSQQIARLEMKWGEAMTNIQKERWVELCELIAAEKNPQKMIELTRELNELLAERIKSQREAKCSSAPNRGLYK